MSKGVGDDLSLLSWLRLTALSGDAAEARAAAAVTGTAARQQLEQCRQGTVVTSYVRELGATTDQTATPL